MHDEVATVEEVDDAIRFGAGLRWAMMGTFLIYRLAGGEDGMRHFMAQFGPALKLPWTKLTEVPELTEAFIDRIAAQSDAQAGGIGLRDWERKRDDGLLAIAAEVKKGGTLSYSFQPEPTALSTIATTAVTVPIPATKIFESLLEYAGPDLKPKPGLARSWTIAPAGLTYTFKLQLGVKWQDGQPFTSADVKFSVEKIILPYHARGKIYFGHLAGIDTPDPQTAVFRLNKHVPCFLKAFQPSEAPMLPQHLLGYTDHSISLPFRRLVSPSSWSPSSVQAQVINLLLRLQEQRGLSYLFISHNLALARRFADRLAVMYLGQIGEFAHPSQLTGGLVHAYSRALFQAMPIADSARARTRAPALPGEPPSPVDPPSGCRFQARCPYRQDICTAAVRPVTEVEGGWVRCHFANTLDQGRLMASPGRRLYARTST